MVGFFGFFSGDGLRQLEEWKAGSVAEEPQAVDPPAPAEPSPEHLEEARAQGARIVLAQLQEESRLVDFLMEDIGAYQDAQIGAAVRQVHGSARKFLVETVQLEPVRSETEGASVTVQVNEVEQIQLMGNVPHTGPWTGTLRHHGWKIADTWRPASDVAGSSLIAKAEVEVVG